MEAVAVVGDWMGSMYTLGGRRWDLFLFLDHGGRFNRTVRLEPDYERQDTGTWEYDESSRILRLRPDSPDETALTSDEWAVLSVTGCEASNVLLVLREIALAGRNLPVLLSRVHVNGRGYGSGWEDRLK